MEPTLDDPRPGRATRAARPEIADREVDWDGSDLPSPRTSDGDAGAGRTVALNRSGGQLPPPGPGRGQPPAPRFELGRRQLGVVLGLLIGAAAMLTSAALSQTTGTVVPVLSNLAAAPVPPNQRPLAQRPPPPSTPGTCLSWRQDDAADALAVDCNSAHLFEQAGTVQLTQFGADAPLPDNQSFRQLVNQECTKMVGSYLNGKYDPDGAFRAGALKPSAKAWFDGNRSMRCGLQRFSRSGALYPIVGKVANQDQADVRPAGTCLGIDGKLIGDPVSCSKPHAVESVGSIDLSQKFSKYPAGGDQDSYLQTQCTKLASTFAGGDQVLASKNLSILWDNLAPESWNAGTRKVTCELAATLPDKSGFAPIVGEVKGPITIGDKPAGPAPTTAKPGAPAEDNSGPAQSGDDNNGGGDVKQQDPKPALPSPSELNSPPKLPSLPNPFAQHNNKDKPANPLDSNAGKSLLGGATDNKPGL